MTRPQTAARRPAIRGAVPGGGQLTRPWLALLVLCAANFLILLDTTIVNTAAPGIMVSLGAGIDDVVWVFNGYLLAFASLLIIFGRAGDILGPRAVFAAGLALFTVASVLCALSSTPGQLVAARVVQGIGAAMLVPQALVLISAIFPAERRGAAFGIFTAMAGVAAVSGVTLGGFLITEFGWQAIFYLNLPVGLAGLVAANRFVPDLRPGRPHRFDVVGVVLATAGLLGIVHAIVEGGAVASGVAGGVLLLLFVLWDRRQPEPLLPLALFRNRTFTIATIISLIMTFSLYGFLLVLVIETQTVMGMSALRSGLTALPLTLALSALAPVSGRVADRIGGRLPLAAGLILFAAGVLGVARVSTASGFLLPLLAVGAGLGIAFAPVTTEAMRTITPAQAGAASGVLNTARQVGAALGAAVTGAVLVSGGLPGAIRPALGVVVATIAVGGVLTVFMAAHSGRRAAKTVPGTFGTESREVSMTTFGRAAAPASALNGRFHRAALNVFLFIVLAHWAEHIAQAIQIWALGWPLPQARGVLGVPFPWLVKQEWLHYGYALVMLAGLAMLRGGFVGRAKLWWTVALGIQIWHHFEHLLLLIQSMMGSYLAGRSVQTSVLQLVFPRVELHLFYNAVVFLPMVVAMYLHLRPSRNEYDAMSCSCVAAARA